MFYPSLKCHGPRLMRLLMPELKQDIQLEIERYLSTGRRQSQTHMRAREPWSTVWYRSVEGSWDCEASCGGGQTPRPRYCYGVGLDPRLWSLSLDSLYKDPALSLLISTSPWLCNILPRWRHEDHGTLHLQGGGALIQSLICRTKDTFLRINLLN